MAIAGLAMMTGDAEDLLFILYFETFPEHWHGNYNPVDLISRLPNFYAHWTMYTGGGLLLAAPFLLGHANRLRNNLRVILGTALLYSLILGTIDHNPSHYFLPLVALTGPAVICAIGSLPNRHIQMAWQAYNCSASECICGLESYSRPSGNLDLVPLFAGLVRP